jgi:hypothetical protein
MTAELSPARIELLKRAIDVQERMLNGCKQVFRGLMDHHDPEVSDVSWQCLEAIKRNQDVLEAMIDGLNATHH